VPSGSSSGAKGGDAPLGLDVLGHLAQRDLAQRGQVLDPEEVVERGLDALLRVDLAGLQSRDQRLARQVDEHDLVGRGDHGVGHGLAHARPGELRHLVVEALEVLDVDGGEDVDARRHDVGDVLVALGVLDPGRIGVRELVDQDQLGRAREDRRQVHLLDRRAAVLDAAAGEHLEPRDQRRGLRPPVRLHEADDDVAAGFRLRLALLQHPVRLADARGHAEEDLVAAALRIGIRHRGDCGPRGRSA
jgi:hypothetical protein